MSRGEFVGLTVAACVACCIGPILGMLGAIAAVGTASTILIGVAGLLIAVAAIAAHMVVRHRRARSCATNADPVPIQMSQSRP